MTIQTLVVNAVQVEDASRVVENLLSVAGPA
jgi:hypothetical protein